MANHQASQLKEGYFVRALLSAFFSDLTKKKFHFRKPFQASFHLFFPEKEIQQQT